MWYVYFLQLNNEHIYVGSTRDLRNRVAEHNAGEVTSTKPHRPVLLKSYVAVETEQTARELEHISSPAQAGLSLKSDFLCGGRALKLTAAL